MNLIPTFYQKKEKSFYKINIQPHKEVYHKSGWGYKKIKDGYWPSLLHIFRTPAYSVSCKVTFAYFFPNISPGTWR